jgi:polyhydroxyalkanoate synthesis repressor PhaR
MAEERIIKKYPNRRLYDTGESRYVTLGEVKDLVMRAVPFKVIDSQTETDLTRAILLQIIMEQESGGQPLFSSAMLERFIRFYGDAAQAALSNFLDQGVDIFQRQQRLLSEQMLEAPAAATNPMDFWLKFGQQSMTYWQDLEKQFEQTLQAGIKAARPGKKD